MNQTQNWQQAQIDGMGFVTGVIANSKSANEVYVRTDVGGIFSWNNVQGK